MRGASTEAMETSGVAHCGWPLRGRWRRPAPAVLPRLVPTTWPTAHCCCARSFETCRLWQPRASSACGRAATRARRRWRSSRWCGRPRCGPLLVLFPGCGLCRCCSWAHSPAVAHAAQTCLTGCAAAAHNSCLCDCRGFPAASPAPSWGRLVPSAAWLCRFPVALLLPHPCSPVRPCCCRSRPRRRWTPRTRSL